MDHFKDCIDSTGFHLDRAREMYPDPCPDPCPPAFDNERPVAGLPSGHGQQVQSTRWWESPCPEAQSRYAEYCNRERNFAMPRPPRPCTGRGRDTRSMDQQIIVVPVVVAQDPLRHVADQGNCMKEKAFGVENRDKLGSELVDRIFEKMGMDQPWMPANQADSFDPCPNKKGPDCDCFNPDGTWRDKTQDKKMKPDPCLPQGKRRCGNDCPECPIEIHSRTVYPKCEAMVPGYGGHVPGLNSCKFGKTFGRETREALQRVFSTQGFKDNLKKC